MMKSNVLICCVLVSLFSVCFGDNVNLTLVAYGKFSIAETDKNYICATLDWWPTSKCDYGNCTWGNAGILNLDLDNKILANAVNAFESGLRLRIGGTLQDRVVYKVGKSPQNCSNFETDEKELLGFSEGCLDMKRWDLIYNFSHDNGAILTFGLNALTGRKRSKNDSTLMVGNWDSENALAFMNYTYSQGHNIDSYELGNELSGQGVHARVEAKQYATDITKLKDLIKSLYPNHTRKPNVLGPGGFYDEKWFIDFLNFSGRNVVDAVTYHVYNLGDGKDRDIINRVEDPKIVDQAGEFYFEVSDMLSNFTWAERWISESGGVTNSGSPQVSNTFANGLWYFNQLGMASKHKHKVFCRQSLIGGYYGLLNSTTFIPNPDYYGALLYNRLMGTKVLEAFHFDPVNSSETSRDHLRVYAHCSKYTTGIALLMINMLNSTTFQVKVNNTDRNPNPREEYHLIPKDGNILSNVVLLNGNELNITKSSQIPALNPKLVNDSTSPIVVQPYSIVFVTLRGFNATICE